MSNRDDLKLNVALDQEPVPPAARKATEERRLAGAHKGVLRRLLAARAKRQAIVAGARKLAGRGALAAARAASGAVTSAGSEVAGFGLRGGLVAVGVAALLVAGVVALRLASGQPLEGTGETLNKMLLGDLDDDARAKMATRDQIEGDSDLARIAGQEGRTNAQVLSVARDLQKFAKQREVGASLMREALPANNILDMLILRGAQAFMAAWKGNGGPSSVEKFRTNYGETITKAKSGKGSSR